MKLDFLVIKARRLLKYAVTLVTPPIIQNQLSPNLEQSEPSNNMYRRTSGLSNSKIAFINWTGVH